MMLWVLCVLATACTGDNLTQSILVFRHGDRSPLTFLPNDIYNSSSWPQGPGQLTQNGQEQLLRAGEFFKARYLDPLKDTYLGIDPGYKSDQVYVRSTDKDRTIMSALCFLAGLFPPGEGDTGRPSPLNVWQPVPVHTIPSMHDNIVFNKNCPNFGKIRRKAIEDNQEFIAFMREHRAVAMKIFEVTGLELEDTTDLMKIAQLIVKVFDTLKCELSAGLPLKEEFVSSGVYGLSKPIFEMMQRTNYGPHMLDTKKSLACGRFFLELKDRVKATAEGDADAKKLVIYSAHDVSLASLLTCLGVYDSKLIPTATVVMLEVWERDGGEISVSLARYNEGDGMLEYTLPGCGEKGCTVEQFLNLNTQFELTEAGYREICDRDIV